MVVSVFDMTDQELDGGAWQIKDNDRNAKENISKEKN